MSIANYHNVLRLRRLMVIIFRRQISFSGKPQADIRTRCPSMDKHILWTAVASVSLHTLMPYALRHENPFEWDLRSTWQRVPMGPHSKWPAVRTTGWTAGTCLAHSLCEAYATCAGSRTHLGPILCLSNFQRVVQVKGCQSCPILGLSTNKTPSWRSPIFQHLSAELTWSAYAALGPIVQVLLLQWLMQTACSKSNYDFSMMMNSAHRWSTDFTFFLGRDSIEATSVFKMMSSEIAMRVLSGSSNAARLLL